MRRLGREVRGFPSVDEVLSHVADYSKERGFGDFTRFLTPHTGKSFINVVDNSNKYVEHHIPSFEGSLSSAELQTLRDHGVADKNHPLNSDYVTVNSVRHLSKKDSRESEKQHLENINQQIREIPNFGQSLKVIRQHLASPQMKNAIENHHRNFPEERPGGRFLAVESWKYGNRGVSSTVDDVIDLKTQDWAEMSPEGWFPT